MMPPSRRVYILALAVACCLSCEALAQPGERYVLLLGGLGGEKVYTDRFAAYLSETRSLLEDRYGIEHTTVLAEANHVGRPFVDDVATADNIRAFFRRLSAQVTRDDHVYIILFGHGSYDGARAQLNIPRQDLDDSDFAELLDDLNAGRIVFVNTASASGPFARTLSGSDRIVISATATGTERDETVFPRHFIEALRSPDADLDKSGGVSVLELFRFAAAGAARSFQETGHLATEHAVLDDNADGEPSRLDGLEAAGDGHLASVTYLRPPEMLANVDGTLLRERDALQRAIAELKSRKQEMSEDVYFAELEELLVSLARLNERIEEAR